MLAEAKYYEKLPDGKVRCVLCPHNCVIPGGKKGICEVRKNENGILTSLNYGKLSAVHLDPIEKKPLYHFYPGKNILSLGSTGCNLKCFFCQNYHISQAGESKGGSITFYKPEIVVKTALRARNNTGVAYTYNEPVVWFEFMLDTAKEVKKAGMKNVMVTNGFINRAPLDEILPFIDAFNIDIKSYSDNFYGKHTKARIQPVFDTIEKIAKSGKHIELTYLLIPTLNDNESEFENLIKDLRHICGKDTVFHISRYFPAYKSDLPVTPEEKMNLFYVTAKKYLNYVYLGNVISDKGLDTECPYCGETIITRAKRYTRLSGTENGKCAFCGADIPIIV